MVQLSVWKLDLGKTKKTIHLYHEDLLLWRFPVNTCFSDPSKTFMNVFCISWWNRECAISVITLAHPPSLRFHLKICLLLPQIRHSDWDWESWVQTAADTILVVSPLGGASDNRRAELYLKQKKYSPPFPRGDSDKWFFERVWLYLWLAWRFESRSRCHSLHVTCPLMWMRGRVGSVFRGDELWGHRIPREW